jgi:long-chain acyl-CoA synthetase
MKVGDIFNQEPDCHTIVVRAHHPIVAKHYVSTLELNFLRSRDYGKASQIKLRDLLRARAEGHKQQQGEKAHLKSYITAYRAAASSAPCVIALNPMGDRTAYNLLEEAAAKFGTLPALYQPRPGRTDGKYEIYNWLEYKQAAEEIAAGLRRLGIQKGDIIGLDAETRAEFYIADLGIMVAGAIAAAAYTTYPPATLVRTFQACDVKAIFVEDPTTLEALLNADGSSLDVKWILLTGEAEGALSFSGLRKLGQTALAEDRGLIDRLKSEVRGEDPAILYMTSGATGEPKMGLVTHQAIAANVDLGPQVLSSKGPNDATIAFLPSAHITQRVAMEFVPLKMGMPVWFSEGLSKLPHEMKSIRPTFFVAPPRVWERIYASVCTEIRKRGGVTRRMFYASLGIGLEVWRRRQEGRSVPPWLSQSLKVADRVVFRKIRARFGGRLTLAISGAAPLGTDLADFYGAIGMPLHEGYGLTEAGIVCLNTIGAPVSGSIGKALPGVELKLGEDGELLIKSPTLFVGYYKDPEATASVLNDGWLATGDIAEIRSDGLVYITGRKKEVLVSSNGKKIYPSRIENLFKVEPLISQVLVLGDRMPYVAALFTLNSAAVESVKGMEGSGQLPMAELVKARPVQVELKKLVARVNQNLAPFEQIRRFQVLDRDFSIQEGELTPTMKVRRAKVIENHKDAIGVLYLGKADV